MESRRIRLLTKAYLNGWLDFKKCQRWSKIREDYILYYLSQQELAEVFELKTLKESIQGAGVITSNKDAYKAADKSYQEHLRLKLSSAPKNDKIKKTKLPSKEEIMRLARIFQNSNSVAPKLSTPKK